MIEYWWPTEIGYYDNINHNKLNLVNYCHKIKSKTKTGGQEWISNETYNTSNDMFHIHKDKKFEKINDWAYRAVNDYIVNTKLDFSINHNYIDSWFNIYKKGDYQDTHNHHNYVISAVYFLKSNPDYSPLTFRPTFLDQLDVGKTKGVNSTNGNVDYKAIPGRLVVFRSFVPHLVGKHKSNKERITLAYNFR